MSSPGTIDGLDNLDYTILQVLDNSDTPLWKKRIHEQIDDGRDHLPIDNSTSLQTTGRRVDHLLADQYVDSVITEPDNTTRDMIIAFTLTDDGRDALDIYRAHLLRQAVKDHLFPEEDGVHMEKPVLLQLMKDYFGFNDAVEQTLQQYNEHELATFLTIRYAQRETVNALDAGHLDEYRDILDQHPHVRNALELQ